MIREPHLLFMILQNVHGNVVLYRFRMPAFSSSRWQTPTGTDAWSETRVWVDDRGHWKNVHFHRSAIGAGASASGAVPDKWDQVLAELEAQVADREE